MFDDGTPETVKVQVQSNQTAAYSEALKHCEVDFPAAVTGMLN